MAPSVYDHKATGLDRTDEGGLVVCERCNGKRHAPLWHHAGQCTTKVDGLFCPNDALIDRRGKPMLFCASHSLDAEGGRTVEAGSDQSSLLPKGVSRFDSGLRKNQAPAFIATSGELAAELGQPASLEKPVPPQELSPRTVRAFYVRSRSRPSQEHLVSLLPERIVCTCEAGRIGHSCYHKQTIEAFILEGVREVPIV